MIDRVSSLDAWVLVKIFWAGLALATAVAVLAWTYRARGLFTWRRRLFGELAAIEETAQASKGPQTCGLLIVATRCRAILHDLSPDIASLKELPAYIRSIAACYHPTAEHPELQATVAAFIKSISASLAHFDRILQLPGFKTIRKLNVRQINASRLWYSRLEGIPLVRWWARHRAAVRRISALRFLLYADPFMLLAFASNRLTTLLLLKYLLVDLYLFMGKVAVDAFVPDPFSTEAEVPGETELQATLEEIYSAGEPFGEKECVTDPEIMAIRRQLVGVKTLLSTTPTPGSWWAAVIGAAHVIARKHFPEAPEPLEEAAVGPLLVEGRRWIDTLGGGQQYLIARRIYLLRLETLLHAKDIPKLLPGAVKSIIGTGAIAYGWSKWPLRIYRWSKRRSPLPVAAAIGWQAAKKTSLAFIYGRAFDHACRTMESIYRESRRMR